LLAHKFSLKKIKILAFLSESLFLFLLIIDPAVLNSLSEGVLVAGIIRYLKAKFLRIGKYNLPSSDHHFSGSFDLSIHFVPKNLVISSWHSTFASESDVENELGLFVLVKDEVLLLSQVSHILNFP